MRAGVIPTVESMVRAERMLRKWEEETGIANCWSRNCWTTISGGMDGSKVPEKATIAEIRER